MRYGYKFQVENCNPQQTVLNKIFLAWTMFIEHKDWTVIQSLMCAQGRTRNALESTVDVDYFAFYSLYCERYGEYFNK